MIELTLQQADLERIAQRIQQLDINDRSQALLKGFQTAALYIESMLKLSVSGFILNVRTGRLRSSIGSLVEGGEDSLKATIGSGVRQGKRVPYADIHEIGGMIIPKRKRFLTIPLDAAKTAAGVTRFTARALMLGQTKYSGSFINKGIIFGTLNKGKSKRVVPLFVLKTSVNIPARYYMSKTLEATQGSIVNIILKKIDEVFNK